MRLPNGYGTVYKLAGARRNPWIARVTKGYDINPVTEKARQIYNIIGYYGTRPEALSALAKFNDNPYDLSNNGKTFDEVYKIWSEEYFKTLTSSSSIRTVKAAYSYCEPLKKMAIRDIRVIHLERTIEEADVGNSTKGRMKSLFNLLYRFALRHEIVDKDYAAICNSVKREPSEKEIVPFTKKEVDILWDSLDIAFADMILVGIYSGWRPQELAILKTKDINLVENTMLGGMKSDAGKNRYVPIHPLIKPLIEKRYNPDNEYLFNDEDCAQGVGKQLTYDKYRGRFIKVMNRLKMEHRPHECRHTFITKAKECNVDEYILKLIVGHAISDLTEKVYTHRTMEQLQAEILKITK